ncbi:hypothetical protein [uncultured Mitsuokella sp.]|uniref:hypothetical protein n=1 Tax=uncultured Mitsuokella sp. TaxID=453120 RepID=UPI00266CA152|nr:hypothetical protein [uncultured Mitsuokella sp.]
MDIVFLNKNRPLMELDIDIQTSYVKEILHIYDKEAMPLAMFSEDINQLSKNFTEWWRSRSIPATRVGLRKRMERLPYLNLQEIINQSFGLSLSDQYWIRPIHMNDLKWEDINYFTNDFSPDYGKYFLGELDEDFTDVMHLNRRSPDVTLDGDVQKRWIIQNGERYLIKNGTLPYVQEPFNEKIASEVLSHMSVPYVSYDVIERNGRYFSSCKDFIDTDHEYVSAYYLASSLHATKKVNSEILLEEAIEKYEIPNSDHFIDQMLCLDYMILNEDRHWTNFGFIRNVETLKFEGPAPIFDNGNSLWYRMNHISEYYDHALTFRKKHQKQIRLVKSFDGIDFDAISKMPDCIYDILKQNKNIGTGRAEVIAGQFKQRARALQQLAIDDGDSVGQSALRGR